MEPSPRYWFPAKRYGWGWGLPTAWQGWAVFAGYLAAVLGPVLLLPEQPAVTLVATLVSTVLLLVVCLKKGEPPSWRWGDRQR